MRRHRWWLGLAVSLVFLALFFYRVNPGEIALAARRADYQLIVPAIVAYFVGLWLRSLRWRLLLEPVRHFAVGELFSILSVGYLVNNVFPARLGEIVRAVLVGERTRVSKTSVLGTIAVERMFDGLALLLIMAVVSFVVPLQPELTAVLRIGGGVFLGAAIVALAVVLARGPALRMVDWALQLLPGALRVRIASLLGLFLDGLESLRSPGASALVLLWSVLAWLAEGAMYYLVSLGFAVQQPPSAILLMSSVANLATAIPSGPGGLGTFDALARWTLELFGSPADEATAYTIVLHAVLWLPVSLLGLFYVWRDNLALGRLTRQSAAPVAE